MSLKDWKKTGKYEWLLIKNKVILKAILIAGVGKEFYPEKWYIRIYNNYSPTAQKLIKPLCSAPNRSPAPLISKSFIAIWKPLPKSENCSIASRRFLASEVIISNGGVIR